VRVRVDGRPVLLSSHWLPDGHPLNRETLDRTKALGADAEREGNERVQVIDIKDKLGVGDVSRLSIDGATGPQERKRRIAQHLWEKLVRVWVEHAVAVAGHAAVIHTPSCGRHGAAMPVALNGGRGVLAANVSNLALELNKVDGLISKNIVVYDQTDFRGELLQEEAIGLRRHRTRERVHGLPVSRGGRVDLRGADSTVLDHLTDGLLPSSAGGVVVPDGVWVA